MGSAYSQFDRGVSSAKVVAHLLHRVWRGSVDPVEIDEELIRSVLPILASGGVVALVSRRLRNTPIADSEIGLQLRDHHRYDVLRNARHELSLKEVFSLCDRESIDAVVVKGWSLSESYPEPGLRVFGDIDLCVKPEDFERAKAVLRAVSGVDVDLHCGFDKFYETRTDELFSRAEVRYVEECPIRVLRFEDHLRFLCLHLLRHGANRPLWLCDIAASIEQIDSRFDWDLCLGSERRQAEWVKAAISLAHELLGANIDHLPEKAYLKELPSWMINTVLAEWEVPFRLPTQLANYLDRPIELLRNLPDHWPNAIEATVNRRGRMNNWPRLPLQLSDALAKTWGLLLGSR